MKIISAFVSDVVAGIAEMIYYLAMIGDAIASNRAMLGDTIAMNRQFHDSFGDVGRYNRIESPIS
jgi:hypothetical protein